MTQSGLLTNEDHGPLGELCAAPHTVKADTVVVEQGAHVKGVHLILSGFAYRYRLLPDGQRQILGILLPGDFCDIQSAILKRSDHFTATLTDSAVVWVPQETVDRLTLAPTRIARALWWATLVDGCILRTWLTNMGQRSAETWFAHLCCELLLRLQVVGQSDHDSCEKPFSQDKLGDILGITSVHVNRVLKELRNRKLLQLKNRRLTVPNITTLRAFCEFDSAYLHLNAGDAVAVA